MVKNNIQDILSKRQQVHRGDYFNKSVVGTLLLLLCGLLSTHAQVFSGSGSFQLPTLGSGVSYADGTVPCNCSASVPSITPTLPSNAVLITVTGVGTLSSTNALTRVDLLFDDRAACGANAGNDFDDITAVLISPTGTCKVIYSKGLYGTNISANGIENTISLATSPTAGGCSLVRPGDGYSAGNEFPSASSGNYGVSAANSGGTNCDLTSGFSGQSANGDWKLVISSLNVTTAGNRPCFKAANLHFGNPNSVGNKMGVNDGKDCLNAINWDGNPLCISTIGKDPATTVDKNVPGYNNNSSSVTDFTDTYAGGGTCTWNSTNDKTVWVKFTPTISSPICINFSGLSDGTYKFQSIIVSDPNADGDNNACTSLPVHNGYGTYWQLEQCPTTSNVYSDAFGADPKINQNYCFTPTAGKTYYWVIDGNASVANTNIYLSGYYPSSLLPLPVELTSFVADYNTNTKTVDLNWVTASEKNNAFFTLEKSLDSDHFSELTRINGKGTVSYTSYYNAQDFNPHPGVNYYRLRQQDLDGTVTYSKIVSTLVPFEANMHVYPNPNNGSNLNIEIKDFYKPLTLFVFDLSGKLVYQFEQTDKVNQHHLVSLKPGIYLLTNDSNLNQTQAVKLVITPEGFSN